MVKRLKSIPTVEDIRAVFGLIQMTPLQQVSFKRNQRALISSDGALMLPSKTCRSLAEAARVLNTNANIIKNVIKSSQARYPNAI